MRTEGTPARRRRLGGPGPCGRPAPARPPRRRRGRARRSGGSVPRGAPPRRATGCAARPSRRRPLRWRSSAYATSRSNARPLVRTRSIGVISCSSVRIGLIFSVEPIHALAAPIRPLRFRNSSVSTANHILSEPRSSSARAATASASSAALSQPCAAPRTIRPMPPAELCELTTRTRSPPLPSFSSRSAAWRAESHVPGDPLGDVDRHHVVALGEQRLVRLDEVADGRLGRGRPLLGRADLVVERVEIGHQLRLALGAVTAEVDVQGHDSDRVPRHELRR